MFLWELANLCRGQMAIRKAPFFTTYQSNRKANLKQNPQNKTNAVCLNVSIVYIIFKDRMWIKKFF